MQTSGRALDPLASSVTTVSQHLSVLNSLKSNTKTLGNVSQNNIEQKKQKTNYPQVQNPNKESSVSPPLHSPVGTQDPMGLRSGLLHFICAMPLS